MLILAYISFISHTWAEHYSGGVYSKQKTSYLHQQPKAIETKKGKRQDTHKIPTRYPQVGFISSLFRTSPKQCSEGIGINT